MQKSVQITVYVVKPRTTNHEHVSGHRRRPLRNCGGEASHGRKAQLLLYSQQLRNMAYRQKTETPKKVKEIRTHQKAHQKVTETLQQISAKKVVPEELEKAVHAKSARPQPSCFREWRSTVLLPSFIGRIFGIRNGNDDAKNKKKLSVSLSEKMNSIMMSSRVCVS